MPHRHLVRWPLVCAAISIAMAAGARRRHPALLREAARRRRRHEELTEVATVVTRDMAAAGVGILTGCDAMIAGFCAHDELALMVAAGMTPQAALQTATINPARYLGREATLGTIAAGKSADLVLLGGNPLQNIANVRRIRRVVTAGRFLDRAALDQLLTQAKAAAQQ